MRAGWPLGNGGGAQICAGESAQVRVSAAHRETNRIAAAPESSKARVAPAGRSRGRIPWNAEHRRGPRRNSATNDSALARGRSEEHTSELQSLMRISYAVF